MNALIVPAILGAALVCACSLATAQEPQATPPTPGKPAAVRECLEILAPAIREGVAHLRGEDPHVSTPPKK